MALAGRTVIQQFDETRLSVFFDELAVHARDIHLADIDIRSRMRQQPIHHIE